MVRVPTAPQTRLLPSRVSGDGETERGEGDCTDKGILLPFPHPSIRPKPDDQQQPSFRLSVGGSQKPCMEGKVAGDPVNLVADLRDN